MSIGGLLGVYFETTWVLLWDYLGATLGLLGWLLWDYFGGFFGTTVFNEGLVGFLPEDGLGNNNALVVSFFWAHPLFVHWASKAFHSTADCLSY